MVIVTSEKKMLAAISKASVNPGTSMQRSCLIEATNFYDYSKMTASLFIVLTPAYIGDLSCRMLEADLGF